MLKAAIVEKRLIRLGVSKQDAEALRLLCRNQEGTNSATWPAGMKYGRVRVTGNHMSFEVSKNPDTDYVDCDATFTEITSIEYVGRIMKQYPRICACLRPCFESPALEIVCEPEIDELEGSFVIIQAPERPTTPLSPADEAWDRRMAELRRRGR